MLTYVTRTSRPSWKIMCSVYACEAAQKAARTLSIVNFILEECCLDFGNRLSYAWSLGNAVWNVVGTIVRYWKSVTKLLSGFLPWYVEVVPIRAWVKHAQKFKTTRCLVWQQPMPMYRKAYHPTSEPHLDQIVLFLTSVTYETLLILRKWLLSG